MGHTTIYRIGISQKPKISNNEKTKPLSTYNSPIKICHATKLPITKTNKEWLHGTLLRYTNIFTETNAVTLPTESILKFPQIRANEALAYIRKLTKPEDFITEYINIPIRTFFTKIPEPLVIYNDDDPQSIITFDHFMYILASNIIFDEEKRNKISTKLYIYNIYDANI